jgi:hypothetical protein
MTRVSIHKLLLFSILLVSHPAYVLAQQQLLVPQNYATIQAAIDAAAAGDTVLISPKPGAYAENLSINADIELRGSETARVILESGEEGDAGTILTVTGTGDVTIRNLTFNRGQTGISINTSLGVEISNNVFALGDNATAIEIADLDSEAFIRNNTFGDNNIAIRSNAAANIVTVENNIFSGNTTPLESGPGIDNAGYNCYATGENQIGGEDPPAVVGNIGFDNPAALDFHLTALSDCIDLGPNTDAIDDTQSDAGAYGGQLADPNPFPPQNPESTPDDDPANYSIRLEWRPNNSYLFKYYNVYYGSQESGVYNGDDAEDDTGAQLTSPFNAGNSTSVTLQNLLGPATPPEAPVLSALAPSFGQIRVNWSEVADADAYIVHWGINSTDENRIEAGSETLYTLTGLENGTRYQVEVSALKQARYYLAVSAVATSLIDNPDNDEIESALSDEVTTVIGPEQESVRSNVESAIPEEVVPYPPLPDQGDSRCFIATSAYGHSNTREVMVLRRFRDAYLLSNRIGREFVGIYYRHSPALAEWLDRHPTLKPAIRIALTPVVWLANSLP